MQKSEFVSLPSALALGLVWDLIGGKLQTVDAPKIPLPPKFDTRVSRKGGQYVWASEMDLESLRYFHKRAVDGVAAGGQYADRSAKEEKSLSFWVKFRECNPFSAWSGERNKQPATGAAPSNKPKLYDWEPKGGGSSIPRTETVSSKGYTDEAYDAGDDLPF